jgi:transposase
MTVKATCLVGLDVHARQTHATVLDRASGELSARRLRGTPEEAVLPFLERLGSDLLAVYEAGPTGFGLAREAGRRGLDVRVVAPGSIPRAPGDRVKTDPRDSLRLVRLLAAGELSFAFVPTVEDEHFRDLVRTIEDVRGDLMRARHRLGKFLLRRGQRYPGRGRAWTARHLTWLRTLRFEDACSQATFADYLASVELLLGRRATLHTTLETAVPDSSHAPVIARIRCFRGIDTLSAAGVCAEVGDFRRFPRPTLLSGFLGIVPSERTSDTRRRQGSITKAGPRARQAAAGRSRPPLPPPPGRRRGTRSPPSRPGPARDRDRLARATAPSPALAAPAPRPPQAVRDRRDRVRPRARLLPVGGGRRP